MHPRGFVDVAYMRQGQDAWSFKVHMPEGVFGTFEFRGVVRALQPGANEIRP